MKKNLITKYVACFYIVALLAVLIPYFLCAPYARACADDWSYGWEIYAIVKNGGSFFACIMAAFRRVIYTYNNWEGRYFSVFLNAFSPGNWKESYYAIVPFFNIFYQIFGQFLFYYLLLGKKARKYIPFVLIPALVMQFLYIGDVSQVYFWYNSGVGYTFEQGLAYVQWGIILALTFGDVEGKRKITALCVMSSVLSFLLSGGNYASALSSLCIIGLVEIVLFIKERSKFFRILPMFILALAGLCLSVLSPGNMNRLNSNFNNETNGVLGSIFMSLRNTALNIYSWFVFNKGWLIALMAMPAVVLISRKLNLRIKHPFIILFLTYGIYATEMVANMYIEGTSGGWRNGAILYGSYYIFLIFNMICICSWLLNRIHISDKAYAYVSKYGITAGAAMFSMMLAVILLSGEYKTTASYTAYRDYRQGIAKEFARQWDERFEILRDDSVTDPVFHQLTEPRCVTLEYTDLQLPDGYTWVNEACRNYYGKNSITVIP